MTLIFTSLVIRRSSGARRLTLTNSATYFISVSRRKASSRTMMGWFLSRTAWAGWSSAISCSKMVRNSRRGEEGAHGLFLRNAVHRFGHRSDCRHFREQPAITSMRKLASGSYLGSLQTRWSAFPERKQIRTFCVYETAPVVSVNITDAIIVARESATNGCSERIDQIADNHIGIVKPANDHIQGFIVLENAYNSMFQATATQLELTAQSLPSLVDLLRVDTRRRNYIVKGANRHPQGHGCSGAWFVENLKFAPARSFTSDRLVSNSRSEAA